MLSFSHIGTKEMLNYKYTLLMTHHVTYILHSHRYECIYSHDNNSVNVLGVTVFQVA
jgi:hypothetical protein